MLFLWLARGILLIVSLVALGHGWWAYKEAWQIWPHLRSVRSLIELMRSGLGVPENVSQRLGYGVLLITAGAAGATLSILGF